MRNPKVQFTVQAAMIAAIYVVVTFVAQSVSFGEVQLRFSEALTILPYFTPAAIPGLFVGCLLGNLFSGAILVDVFCGSIATLIGAIVSYLLRCHKYLVPLPPIIANILIVPYVLKYGYMAPFSIPFMMITVGIGEILSCGVIGLILLTALEKYRHILFSKNNMI